MKILTIAALLAVSFFAIAPAAKAADWNNDTLSCDVKIFADWLVFDAMFYQTAKPEVTITYECASTGFGQYSCFLKESSGGWDLSVTQTSKTKLLFPVLTERIICGTVFRLFHPTPK